MSQIERARANTIQGLSHISNFWGFSKGMGAIFGVLFLSPSPLSLDELVEQVGITKGAVSTNVRQLERLGLVHQQIVIGERKDYYEAETDFWKVVKSVLREREQNEFDRAIRTVSESLEMVESASDLSPEEVTQAMFYQKRMKTLADFFKMLDNLVAMILALDSLRLNPLEMWFGKEDRK
jgi:HTH-type transcriptional regulator, glycine betaine synthesis regulator